MTWNHLARALLALTACASSLGWASQAQTDPKTDHRKQFAQYARMENLRDADGSSLGPAGRPVRIVVDPGHGTLDPSTIGFTATDFVQRHVCAADVVLVGVPRNGRSEFTAEGTFIFTDYDVDVETVVKGDPALSSTRVQVAWPGGSVMHKGRSITTIDSRYEWLQVNRRFLLFLHQIAPADFISIQQTAGYDLSGTQARAMRFGTSHDAWDSARLITIAQAASANCGK